MFRIVNRPFGCLTPNEVGAMLNVTGAAVKLWIRNGQMPGVKGDNGYWWIQETDVKRKCDPAVENKLVRINDINYPNSDDDGVPRWHLVDPCDHTGNTTLCDLDLSTLSNLGLCVAATKTAPGGITCPHCLDNLRMYRAVRV